MLTKYYELKLMSFAEMEEYEANKSDLINLAKSKLTKNNKAYFCQNMKLEFHKSSRNFINTITNHFK